jgi:hypothetical protein
MKIRRKVIEDKWREVIETLNADERYSQAGRGPDVPPPRLPAFDYLGISSGGGSM